MKGSTLASGAEARAAGTDARGTERQELTREALMAA
jgi:hypothetical protein